jgi:class 3 adenylate cyclase
MSEIRKIAAILVADVVGYSRLAGADEDRTLSRLRGLRSDLIDPAIAAHRGRIVKRTGDGSLIEFRSVVDAVRCAIEVQNGLIERNAGLPPERRIEFRVGIHLGDVVEESDGDLMGDGVNIAARLESIAKPGAICLSEQPYWQVKGRLDLASPISARPNSRTSPSRNTAFTYKGKPVDAKAIGKDLGVRYVLEGSVQPSAAEVRVNAQLIDADSGAHVWAEQFDTPRADVLQTQDEIVTHLAHALLFQLPEADLARTDR